MRDNVQAGGPEDYFKKSITVPFLGYTLNKMKTRFTNLHARTALGLQLVPDIKKAYRKHKHHLQKFTRQAYWRYIEGIITPDDLDRPYTGMKKFWTYIKHRRKDNSGALSLKLNGKLYCDPTTKSNILNQQFKSAFSQRTTFTSNEFADSHRMPDADYPIMPDFKFTSNGI